MSGTWPTYAEWLRARDDDELSALFAARPELITPVPADLDALASRAVTPAAVTHALDRLDRFTLAVAEAVQVLSQARTAPDDWFAALRDLLGAETPEEPVRDAVARLRTRGIVWGDDAAPRPAPGLRQAIREPAGLGPEVRTAFRSYSRAGISALLSDIGADPAGGLDSLEACLSDVEVVSRLLETAGPEARAALQHMTWGPPLGRIEQARRAVRIASAATPIERLLALGLLAATDDQTVTLPREVALILRGGRLHKELAVVPPGLGGAARPVAEADGAAAGQALQAVRAVEELLDSWGDEPPGVLRGGGLGVRDLRTAALALDVEEWTAALLIEVARAAGLLTASDSVSGEWLPAKAYDLWLLHDIERRWAVLASAWLESDRAPGLAGEKDDKGKRINVLGTEMIRPSAPRVRRAALGSLVAAPEGVAPGADAVIAHLLWHQPRRQSPVLDRLVGWTLREAEVLGVTGRGALTTHARKLLAGDPAGAAESLTGVLPELVDHVLVQADLTAVAPGPLVSGLARELALCADVESTGAATVYRFTPNSIRRGLDAGRSAAELTELLRKHSATPLPQPLTYLIEDVSRRHGNVRVGTASSYLRCDDPVTLDAILADRRASLLRMRRLAPTVLASPASRTELLETLRSMGYAPVAESADGAMVVTRPDARRAESPGRAADLMRLDREPQTSAASDDELVRAAVRALRAGEEAARVARPDRPPAGGVPRTPAAAMIDKLRAAVSDGARVWIGYLDQQGQASSRIVEPARVEGGYLTAYDTTRAAIQRFALHRITGVAELP